MDLFAVQVSNSLHRDALVNVLHAPMSFFGKITFVPLLKLDLAILTRYHCT